MDNPAFQLYKNIISAKLPSMGIKGCNAWIKDFASTSCEKSPMAGGLFRLEKGDTLHYTYTYHELKYIVDGHFIITDGSGQKQRAEKGDLLYFPNGTKTTFATDD